MPAFFPYIRRPLPLAALSFLIAAVRVLGQEGPAPTTLEVVAEAPVGFTRVGGVRELSDGRVLLVDQLEIEGYLLDSSLRSRSTIARKGSGPKEYRTPHVILPFGGDSSAIIDIGLLRILLLDADGQPYDVVSRERAGGGRILRLDTGYKYASDGRQHIYSEGSILAGIPGAYEHADSVSIERWRFGDSQRDTVAMMPVNWAGPVPFRPQPEWAVCSNGRIIIAYPDPYHVESLTPEGDRIRGGVIPHHPVPVTEAIQEGWLDTGGHMVHYMLRGGGGGRWRVETGRRREPEAWPKTLPPFPDGGVHCAPGGNTWIERAVAPGEPVLVDIVDQRGALARQFLLPYDSRIVGFGDSAVYVVVKDSLDLEHLLRLRIPDANGSSPT